MPEQPTARRVEKFVCFLLLILLSPGHGHAQRTRAEADWDSVRRAGAVDVTIFWYENKPVLYRDDTRQLTGIEYDLLHGFSEFLRDSFHVALRLHWQRQPSFQDAYRRVTAAPPGWCLGAARISISEERKKEVGFSPPYMADLSVLLTSEDLPQAKSKEELLPLLSSARAVTMPGTTFEQLLASLEKEYHLRFSKTYRSKAADILNTINSEPHTLGYVSLLTYLFRFNESAAHVKRQNFFIESGSGFAFIFPKGSSIATPLNAYFSSPIYKKNIDRIISNYIDVNLYRFMDALAQQEDQETRLLNLEKELQQTEINLKEATIDQAKASRKIIVLTIIILLAMFGAGLTLYKRQLRNHSLLKEQRDEIAAQAAEIRAIHDNLSALVSSRTRDLEEKNKHLEQSAFFTAHKLRAPVASILGLLILVEKIPLTDGNKKKLAAIQTAAVAIDEQLHAAIAIIENAASDPHAAT